MEKINEQNAEELSIYIDNVMELMEVNYEDLKSLPRLNKRDRAFEVADALFIDGRYNVKSEYVLETWDDPEFEKIAHNVRVINLLDDEHRDKFNFILKVVEVARPLFKRQLPDLTQPPFSMKNTDVTKRNIPLLDFACNSPYPHLGATLLYTVFRYNINFNEYFSSIAMDTIAYEMDCLNNGRGKKGDLRKKNDEAWEDLTDIFNHIELAKHMNMTPRQLMIYDAFDTYVSDKFYAEQVDLAKEMDQWIDETWTGYDPERVFEQCTAVAKKLDDLINKYDITPADPFMAISYIVNFVLEMPVTIREHPNPSEDNRYRIQIYTY